MSYTNFINIFRFEAHLINEHGALYDIDFLVQISQFKENHNVLPNLVLAGAAAPGATTPKVNKRSTLLQGYIWLSASKHLLQIQSLGNFRG